MGETVWLKPVVNQGFQFEIQDCLAGCFNQRRSPLRV